MHTKFVRAGTIVLLTFLIAGCGRMFGWKSSGVPKALAADALVSKAGAIQGIKLTGVSQSEESDSRSIASERRFSAVISRGTSSDLLTAYRQEVGSAITNGGGTVRGAGRTGSQNSIQDFSYNYVCGGNTGIVRVYSFVGTNGQVEIISFCYEH